VVIKPLLQVREELVVLVEEVLVERLQPEAQVQHHRVTVGELEIIVSLTMVAVVVVELKIHLQ
jgi:hypothetical protein